MNLSLDWRQRMLKLGAVLAVTVVSLGAATAFASERGARQGAGALPKHVVAEVNGETVTVEDFKGFLRAYVAQTYYHGVEPDRYPAIASAALELLITDRLLLQEAGRRKIKGDAKAAAKRLAALRKRYSRTPERAKAFDKQAAKVRRELLDDTRIEALRKSVRRVGPLKRDAVRAFYKSNPKLFTLPAAADTSFILLAVPPHGVEADWRTAMTKAEALVGRIRAGEAFADIAAAHSDDPSGKSGGRLGLIHKGQFPKHVAAKLDGVGIGRISDPIRVLEGVAIFKINKRQPARLQKFDTVAARAEALLRRKLENRRWDQFLSALRRKARIKKRSSLAEIVKDL